MPIPDHLLVFTKRIQKLQFLHKVVENTETTTRMQFRKLEELHCPCLDQLVPELCTRTVPTLTKAIKFLACQQRCVLRTIATKRETVSQTCTCPSIQFCSYLITYVLVLIDFFLFLTQESSSFKVGGM